MSQIEGVVHYKEKVEKAEQQVEGLVDRVVAEKGPGDPSEVLGIVQDFGH